MAALGDYETSRSRDTWYRGKRFYGERVFEVPKAELSTYESDYDADSGNIWPGYADEWSASAGTYAVGATVQGDGSPNSYVYICIKEHTAHSGKEPPEATYWARVQHAPFIQAYRITRDMKRRPGKSLLRVLYGKPRSRDVLRRNPGKAILELNISAEAVKVYYEPVTAPAYSSGTAYAIGDRVTSGGLTYVCIKISTDHTPARTSAYWRASSRVVEGPEIGAEWSSTVTYAEGDIVWHETGSDGRRIVYRSILNSPANLDKTPGTDTTYWAVTEVKWVALNGSNTRLRGKAIIRLVSVTSTFDPDTHIGKIGYTNSAAVSDFGTFATTGKLLFIGYKTTKILGDDGLSDVEYYFAYDPDGWSGSATVQRMRKSVIRLAVLDEDGTDSGKNSRVVTWMPDPIADAVPNEERNMTNGPTSFAAFNAMLQWDT